MNLSENNGNKKGHTDPQPGHGKDNEHGHKQDKPKGNPTKPGTSHCLRI